MSINDLHAEIEIKLALDQDSDNSDLIQDGFGSNALRDSVVGAASIAAAPHAQRIPGVGKVVDGIEYLSESIGDVARSGIRKIKSWFPGGKSGDTGCM